jgi:bifunctional enzyme CysN/CysC
MEFQNMGIKSKNITAVAHRVEVQERWQANNHRGGVMWFTGLSGSGKTTLAFEIEQQLFYRGYQVYVLDGDNVRHGLSSDLGFAHKDRTENIRRIGEVAALFAEAGTIVISAFISPYLSDRSLARKAIGEGFHEIYLSADLATCEARDPKGLYKKAHNGEISDFTGVSAPYEDPREPDLIIDSGKLSIEVSVNLLVDYVDKVFKL